MMIEYILGKTIRGNLVRQLDRWDFNFEVFCIHFDKVQQKVFSVTYHSIILSQERKHLFNQGKSSVLLFVLRLMLSASITSKRKLVLNTKTDWKHFGLELGKLDVWDIRLEIAAIHLHYEVKATAHGQSSMWGKSKGDFQFVVRLMSTLQGDYNLNTQKKFFFNFWWC